MSEKIGGRGDPARTLQLLWNQAPAPRRGPKPKASVAGIVAAAVAIADAEGLDAVSTRRVAEAVGISPMSFYTHVPGKAELFDLMLDAVAAPDPDAAAEMLAEWSGMGWRARLEIVAREVWDFYLRHPWVLDLATHRPVLGPNTLAAWEAALTAVDGVGLDELEMDRVVTTIHSYVYGAVRDAARQKLVDRATGMTDDEWWQAVEPVLGLIDFSPYPVSSRVGPVTGATYGLHDPEGAFAFGLERLLDGIGLLVARKQGG